jgi:hypothetical protein
MSASSVISIVVIILLVYIVIRVIWRKEYTGTIAKANVTQKVPNAQLESLTGSSNECTYSIWIYIDDWNYKYGKKKTVFKRGDFELYLGTYENEIIANSPIIKNTDVNSEVDNYTYTTDSTSNPVGTWIDPNKSNDNVNWGPYKNLKITRDYTTGKNKETIQKTCGTFCNSMDQCIGYDFIGDQAGGQCSTLKYTTDITPPPSLDKYYTTTVVSGVTFTNTFGAIKNPSTDYTICKVSKIPTQQWVNIVVSISSISVDMYINGKLTKTTISSGSLSSTTGDVSICPASTVDPTNYGFSGWVARFEFWARYMTPQDIWKIY